MNTVPATLFAETVAGFLSRRVSVAVYTVVRTTEPLHYPAGAKVICPTGSIPKFFGLENTKARALSAKLLATDEADAPRTITVGLSSDSQQIELTVYCETLKPPMQCVIVGAGHIARTLAAMADAMSWSVVVTDDRSDFVDLSFFPERTRLLCVPFSDIWKHVELDDSTAVVLVTRGHEHDESTLRSLASDVPFYIGMIGSRRRVEIALKSLRDEGVPEAMLQRIYAPVGLPLGADSPEEIALAIAAEIMAVWRGRGDWAKTEKNTYYQNRSRT
jgi:xanthine dehydrogenase accessory factor